MAFRALLFCKNPETNKVLTEACQGAGIRPEVCEDVFSAIEKGTKQPFSCVVADWFEQPEAGFLLKRARESSQNVNTVAIAIVDTEPTAAEMRDHRLNFLIYRPVSVVEAQEVFAKASESMQSVSAAVPAEPRTSESIEAAARGARGTASSEDTDEPPAQAGTLYTEPDEAESDDATDQPYTAAPRSARFAFPIQKVCAAVLALAAGYALWMTRDTIAYLSHTRENKIDVFKQAIASLFYMNQEATPVGAAVTDAQQDAYFSRSAASPTSQPKLGVVATEAEVSESHFQSRPSSDFPLPTPVYEHPEPPPVHSVRATIPDSLRGSAPITPPVVVTVTPGQMMPVSSPAVPPIATQQFGEPVSVSEEAERSLLVHNVAPAYPQEAVAQKLHGPVVLLATIGRDGSVEDLKIVRGNFILCKAAIAAVKQWRFQPYTVNGRTEQVQTYVTVNFTAPGA
jgi:TonB family protein